jgi:hypothetical protein
MTKRKKKATAPREVSAPKPEPWWPEVNESVVWCAPGGDETYVMVVALTKEPATLTIRRYGILREFVWSPTGWLARESTLMKITIRRGHVGDRR